MAAISQTIYLEAFMEWKGFYIDLKFHWYFVPKGPIDNNPLLV